MRLTVTATPCGRYGSASEVVCECGIKQDKPAHSVSGLGQFRFLRVQCSHEVIFGVVAACGD